MSLPTPEELAALHRKRGDGEMYHGMFDDLLERKLMALDPEWMTAMQAEYERSGMARWCA